MRTAAEPPSPEVFHELVRLLYRQGLTGARGNLIVAAVSAAAFIAARQPTPATLALLAVVVVYVHRMVLVRRFERSAPADAQLQPWYRAYLLSSLAGGSAWGLWLWNAYPTAPESVRFFMMVTAFGLTAAGVATLGAIRAVYAAYLLPFFTAAFVAVSVHGLADSRLLGAMLVLYAAVMLKSARESQKAIADSVRLSLENRALVGELTEARDRAERAQAQAETGNNAKSELLAKVSHEIRTPMNGILGMTELLLTGNISGEQRLYAETAHQSGQALMTMVNDLLDHSKLEAGKMTLEEEPFEVEAVVEEVVALFGVSAAKKGLVLAHLVDAEVPRRVIGDATRLRQVLANLVGNALKFTERGEIELRVRPGTSPDRLRISVRDSGLGMDADTVCRLFSAFVQADRTISRRFGGTGLGLSIVKQLVELMDGRVEVDSAIGRGRTFTCEVRLPAATPSSPEARRPLARRRVVLLAPQPLHAAQLTAWTSALGGAPELVRSEEELAQHLAEGAAIAIVDGTTTADTEALARRFPAAQVIVFEPPLRLASGDEDLLTRLTTPLRRSVLEAALRDRAPARAESTTAFAPRPRFNGARILVADDNTVNRMVISGMLGRLDCAPLLVADGQQALDALRQQDFDLVFMDCEMPVLDGLEVTREIRRDEGAGREDPRIVVALTAHALAAHRERCLEAGMNDVLTKPVSLRALEQCLTQWIGH